MNPTVYIDIAGKRYPMRFSTGAIRAISERYGSLDEMSKRMQGADSDMVEAIDVLQFLLATLIAQGCAYKNLFDAATPALENAPIVDGKYVPLTEDELNVALDFADFEMYQRKVFETMRIGQTQTIEAEAKGKKKNEKAV